MTNPNFAPGVVAPGGLPAAAPGNYAEDRAEIENLSNRYMIAVDAGDIDAILSAWADEGVLEWAGGTERGRVAIGQAMTRFRDLLRGEIAAGATSRQRTRHVIFNHVIDVTGDTAKTVAYWIALTNKTPQKDVQLVHFGHYEDELVKRDGRWLFTVRRVFNESLSNRALFYPGLGERDPRE